MICYRNVRDAVAVSVEVARVSDAVAVGVFLARVGDVGAVIGRALYLSTLQLVVRVAIDVAIRPTHCPVAGPARLEMNGWVYWSECLIFYIYLGCL